MSRNSAHSAEIPASVMSPLTRTRSSGSTRVQRREPLHRAHEPLVAARAGAPALDAKAVALADDMHVGEMRDAPDAVAGAGVVEPLEIERLVGGRVGEAPDERGDREIGGHDDDRVGDRRKDEELRRGEIGDRADPARRRPRRERDQRRDGEEKQPGGGAALARRRASDAPLRRFSDRSVRCRSASRQSA